MSSSPAQPPPHPPAINYVAGFLLVGIAWGLTTPFIRRAAKSHNPPSHPLLLRDDVRASWLKTKLYGTFFAVLDLLRNPGYAIPLLINLTGSVWFFLLIGQAGEFSSDSLTCNMQFLLLTPLISLLLRRGKTLMADESMYIELSLTVPIVNTLAFLFTVLGDWWVDKKVIDRSESSNNPPKQSENIFS